VVAARKGLLADTLDGEDGAKKKKKKDKKKANNQPGGAGSDSMAGSLEPAFAGGTSNKPPASSEKNWIPNLANVNADFGEKPTKALVLANGNFVLAKWDDQIFCCDCNSTAYQFPLVDGELFYGPSGPAIRVPLDGTEYDLTTGDVITWCPRNNPVRQALGALKSAAEPVPLPIYKTRVDEQGNVACNFVDKVDVRREGFANKAAESIEGGKGVEIAQKRPEEGAASAASAGEASAPAASSSDDASPQEAPSTVVVVGLALVAAAVIFLQLNPGE
jgi:nitrite reductase/ring-hydroxylating ferredoxin subunit